MSFLCIKTRTCLLFATFVIGAICVTFLWIIEDDKSRPKDSWNNLVSRTQQHIWDLHENRHRWTETDSYLRLLGFDPVEYLAESSNGKRRGEETSVAADGAPRPSRPSVRNLQSFTNLSTIIPVIAVPVQSAEIASAWELYKSVLFHIPEMFVFFYDVGLRRYDKLDLTNRCKNVSTWRTIKPAGCQVRSLDWSSLPGHLMQYSIEAYRPLIIHDVLNISGAVLYLSPTYRFRARPNGAIFDKARRLGLVGWRLNDDSTSAMTHPKTFRFIGTDPQNYYFHHTIAGDRLIVYNTEFVRQLMYRWLQCSLTERCVSPIGAQDTGCRIHRKPLYLYSGCHHYDSSVMNVVLGMLFNFDSSLYTLDFDEGRFVANHHDV